MEIEPFDRARYQDTSMKIRSLKAKLPEDDLVDIAREVLNRVAKKYACEKVASDPGASDKQIAKLAEALIGEDANAGLEFVLDLRDRGVDTLQVYLSYLAKAAALLGAWWDEDRVSLFDVTLGTSRIYGIIRALSNAPTTSHKAGQRYATFVSTPVETHTLGVQMAADLFRRDDWKIDLLVGRSHDEIITQIDASGAPIVGISAGGIHATTSLTRLVLAIRVQCPSVYIFVSGQIIEDAPEVVEAMCVDGIAKDVPEAMAVMEDLWARHLG